MFFFKITLSAINNFGNGNLTQYLSPYVSIPYVVGTTEFTYDDAILTGNKSNNDGTE